MPDVPHGDMVPASFLYLCVCVCAHEFVSMYVYVNTTVLIDAVGEAVPVQEYGYLVENMNRFHTQDAPNSLTLFVHSFTYACRLSHTERDTNMKRQLVEDLKTRLKFLQDMEKSYRGQVEELEKKVRNTKAYNRYSS